MTHIVQFLVNVHLWLCTGGPIGICQVLMMVTLRKVIKTMMIFNDDSHCVVFGKVHRHCRGGLHWDFSSTALSTLSCSSCTPYPLAGKTTEILVFDVAHMYHHNLYVIKIESSSASSHHWCPSIEADLGGLWWRVRSALFQPHCPLSSVTILLLHNIPNFSQFSISYILKAWARVHSCAMWNGSEHSNPLLLNNNRGHWY